MNGIDLTLGQGILLLLLIMDEHTPDIHYLTQEKKTELERELLRLRKEMIPTVAKRIDEAKQLGDLSENAEYHAAKDEMMWVQTRLKEIEAVLGGAELIIKPTKTNRVDIGSTVTVMANDKERQFTIVGPQEADPSAGRISNESPLGQAFLGRSVGDTIEVEIPSGRQTYRILSIE